MIDHAKEALEMAHGRSRPDLGRDRMLELALLRLMEVVGEAASRVPDEYRLRHSQIPWREVSDFRNRLIHGYDAVNLDILWTIIQVDLPRLIEQLEAIVAREA